MILEGDGLQLPKIGGGQSKTQGQTALKNGGGSLAVGSYLQRVSPYTRVGSLLRSGYLWGRVVDWYRCMSGGLCNQGSCRGAEEG